ncbi:methylated-DNA--[protein]-cysteine S-methyltransferase [Streptomonospora arabica]|uniref:Methylated-DNA--protein-cysteine methyltransferase n=1 Tax=Streptomonospora halophila TaxID=427369 RepID=A0ABP9H526_9ACTN
MTADPNTIQDALPLEVAEPASERVAPARFAEPRSVTPLYDLVPSPLGELLLIGDGEAVTGLYMSPHERFAQEIENEWRREPAALREAAEQLGAYFAGELRQFSLPLAPRGTAFQRTVWSALTTIPHGRTATYGEIARSIGQPNASRAVGMANNRNPISILVPCHRVIGANGALVGYGGGIPRKESLLSLERGTGLNG